MARRAKVFWISAFVICVGATFPLVFNISHYLVQSVPVNYLFKEMPDYAEFQSHLSMQKESFPFLIHVFSGALAILLSLVQIVRKKGDRIHRYCGRGFFFSFGICSIAGILISTRSFAGPIAATGFFLLGVSSIVSLVVLLIEVKRKRFASHGRWSLRAVALAFSAVSLRLEMALLSQFLDSMREVLQIAAWSCWLGNILLLEAHFFRNKNWSNVIKKVE